MHAGSENNRPGVVSDVESSLLGATHEPPSAVSMHGPLNGPQPLPVSGPEPKLVYGPPPGEQQTGLKARSAVPQRAWVAHHCYCRLHVGDATAMGSDASGIYGPACAHSAAFSPPCPTHHRASQEAQEA